MLQRASQLREVMILAAGSAVGEELSQSEFAAGKRQISPRNLRFAAQARFQALSSGAEDRLQQTGAEHDMHLSRMSHVDHREEGADFHGRQGLFLAFARRR